MRGAVAAVGVDQKGRYICNRSCMGCHFFARGGGVIHVTGFSSHVHNQKPKPRAVWKSPSLSANLQPSPER